MVNPKLVYPKKKLPSYLKDLVDRRARAEGLIQRLTPAVAEAHSALEKAAAKLTSQRATLARAVIARDSCDTLLRKWNESLDTEAITPVHAWRRRYGERGALQVETLKCLDAAGSSGLATGALADRLTAIFELSFLSREARTDWVRNSLTGGLKVLVAKGILERVFARGTGATGKVWRRVQPVESDLDYLVQMAQAAGLAIKSGSMPRARSK